jgi:hypothetical protein
MILTRFRLPPVSIAVSMININSNFTNITFIVNIVLYSTNVFSYLRTSFNYSFLVRMVNIPLLIIVLRVLTRKTLHSLQIVCKHSMNNLMASLAYNVAVIIEKNSKHFKEYS